MTRFELVCFLLRLGVRICCAHSTFEISFAFATSTRDSHCGIASIHDSGDCAYAFEPFRVLDDLSAVVLRLSRICLQDRDKKRRC